MPKVTITQEPGKYGKPDGFASTFDLGGRSAFVSCTKGVTPKLMVYTRHEGLLIGMVDDVIAARDLAQRFWREVECGNISVDGEA